jgi:SAM-dependent methyltransferase
MPANGSTGRTAAHRWRLTLPGAAATARRYCGPHCFGYHATWRLFRHTGLKGNPRWHTGFYTRALDGHRLPTDRPVRILICAASDETMLAVLARLLHPRRLDVTLVDACRTPLLLAAAYAERHHLTLTTMQAHAPDLPTFDAPFDLAVTDGLLSLLSRPGDSDALLHHLAAVLRPDGLLLYTTRIAGTGTLEYDRVGRAIQAAAALAWRGAPAQRRDLARGTWQQRSRPNPFTRPNDVSAAFTAHFAQVRLTISSTAHTVAQRLHPSRRRGAGSISVGVAAAGPRNRL